MNSNLDGGSFRAAPIPLSGEAHGAAPGVYFLAYASVPRDLFVGRAELMKILEVSRINNAKVGVTGILLYKDGLFLQVIEGDRDAVKQLYVKISLDARHHSLEIIHEGETQERQFANWSMAFRNLDDPDLLKVSGYSRFMNEHGDVGKLRADPSGCWTLLQLFRNEM